MEFSSQQDICCWTRNPHFTPSRATSNTPRTCHVQRIHTSGVELDWIELEMKRNVLLVVLAEALMSDEG